MAEENKKSSEADKLTDSKGSKADESKPEKSPSDNAKDSKEESSSTTDLDPKSESAESVEKDKKESEIEMHEKETDDDLVVDDDDKPLSQIKKDIQNKSAESEDKPPSPPPKPPRPLSPFSQNHLTLSEAFPTVEPNVVRAVLVASSGLVDPAFNGLLSLTDPDYKIDDELLRQQQQTAYTQLANILKSYHQTPPPTGVKTALRKPGQAPRYRQQHPTGGQALNAKRAAQQASAASTIRSSSAQIEEDEKLARVLAAKYDAEQRGERRVRYADTGRGTTYTDPSIDNPSRRNSRGRKSQENSGYGYEGGGPDAYQEHDGYAHDYDYDDDDDDMYKDRSFFDDELPQIKENLTKGFIETKEKMNSWVENLKKKIDGDEKQPGIFSGILNNNKGGVFGGFNGFASGSGGSKNDSRQRPGRYYDQDPEELNFSGISMKDETNPRLPPRPDRKPTVVDVNSSSNTSNGSDSNSKWEPLNSASPNRMDSLTLEKSDSTETKDSDSKSAATANSKKIPLKSDNAEDDDPFFIGDSDDEDEDTKTTKK